jgi:hypothetical protein
MGDSALEPRHVLITGGWTHSPAGALVGYVTLARFD